MKTDTKINGMVGSIISILYRLGFSGV